LRIVPDAQSLRGVRPCIVEDELTLAVVLEVAGCCCDELALLPDREVVNNPPRSLADALRTLECVEPRPREEWEARHAIERVPVCLGDFADAGVDSDLEHALFPGSRVFRTTLTIVDQDKPTNELGERFPKTQGQMSELWAAGRLAAKDLCGFLDRAPTPYH